MRIILSVLIAVSCTFGFCAAQDSSKQSPRITRQWVEDHPDSVLRMTRSQWLEIDDYQLQKKCFGLFSPQQRLAFWVGKLREVQQLDWSPEEKKHIDEMMQFMLDHCYIFSDDEGTREEYNRILLEFATSWQKKAVDMWGWSPQTVGAMLMEGNRMLTKEGDLDGPSRICL